MSIDSELHGHPDDLCQQLKVAIAVRYISEKLSLSISAFFYSWQRKIVKKQPTVSSITE